MANGHEDGLKNQDHDVETTSGKLVMLSGVLSDTVWISHDDVVVLENSETEEEDVKEDESNHNKERYTFEDDDDDEEFDDLDWSLLICFIK
ncbi:hypothetical protein Tco_0578164 [Tanacetum coccineum]